MKKTLLFFLCLFIAFPVFPQEKNFPLLAEGKYFSVYGYNELDIGSLLKKVDSFYLGNIDSVLNEGQPSGESSLAKAIDSLYLEVSDILDIHIYSFHGKIIVVPDKSYISSVFKEYTGNEFPERSFYFPQKNTIYISFTDLTTGMLGHEMAHAIISRYFVVPPPATVQEVLCGYVEFKLRKKTKK